MPASPDILARIATAEQDELPALVCIPHAGAGASIFAGWRALRDIASVWAVRLPGRENRILEEPYTSIDQMADALVAPVTDLPGSGLVLFGHCSGAFIAYELAGKLTARAPVAKNIVLVVSSQVAPSPRSAQRGPSPANLAPAELVEYLRGLGGTPEEILRSAELMELLEPMIRADLQASDRYSHERRTSFVHIPIVAISAVDDGLVDNFKLARWKVHTTGSFRTVNVDGHHFDLTEPQSSILQAVRGIIIDANLRSNE